ncbi:hypothetical protein GW17_00023944, partial [Ensete ventricosum]
FDDEEFASKESLWDSCERWRSCHHRVSRDLDEARKRFDVFRENVEFIHAFNKKESPYKLRFVDMTNEEFQSWYTGFDMHHL